MSVTAETERVNLGELYEELTELRLHYFFTRYKLHIVIGSLEKALQIARRRSASGEDVELMVALLESVEGNLRDVNEMLKGE